MSAHDFAWRDRVADPNWLVYCASCRHAEQHHHPNGCHTGTATQRCICMVFRPGKRTWVGPPDERPVA